MDDLNIIKPVFIFSETDTATAACFESISNFNFEDLNLVCFGLINGTIKFWNTKYFNLLHSFKISNVEHLTLNLIHPNELRINSIVPFLAQNRILIQLHNSTIYLLKLDLGKQEKPELIEKWETIKSFYKCIKFLDKYCAFINDKNQLKIVLMDDNLQSILINYQQQEGLVSFRLGIFNNRQLFIMLIWENGLFQIIELLSTKSFEELFQLSKKIFETVQIFEYKMKTNYASCLDFNASTQTVLICGQTEYCLLDINEIKIKQLAPETIKMKNNWGSITCCAIRPDGQLFVIGTTTARILLFSIETGQLINILTYHQNVIEAIQFSGRTIVDNVKHPFIASSSDKKISLWSLDIQC